MTQISVVKTSGYNFFGLRHLMEKFSLFRHSDIIKRRTQSGQQSMHKKKNLLQFFRCLFPGSILLCTNPSIYVKNLSKVYHSTSFLLALAATAWSSLSSLSIFILLSFSCCRLASASFSFTSTPDCQSISESDPVELFLVLESGSSPTDLR